MTRLTDGKRIVDIKMAVWSDESVGYSEDWSSEFFDTDSLPYDYEVGAHRVQNVDYCIDQAIDCINRTGDFAGDDEPVPGSTLLVDGVIVAEIPTR